MSDSEEGEYARIMPVLAEKLKSRKDISIMFEKKEYRDQIDILINIIHKECPNKAIDLIATELGYNMKTQNGEYYK